MSRESRKAVKQKISGVFDIIGEILAVLLVLVFALLIINANFNFLDKVPWLFKALTVVKEYGGLLLIAIVGIEAMVKRNIFFLIIFLALLALVIIFLFFPGTYQNFINLISKKS